MGYKYSHDLISAYQQIRSAAKECSDPKNDGFVAWGVKQDLYNLRDLLNEAIRSCPNFGDTESEWLRDQEQKKIIKILKDDIQ
jgi:hypothetical protein